jgi:beta-lactamase superfamily II metal-dependent hydrolase
MPDRLTIRMLGIGHGDAVLLTVQGEDMTWRCLVDGGKSPERLRPRLREVGVDSLDLLILSHFDHDHLGGLMGITDIVAIRTYWGPALGAFDRHFWLFGRQIQGSLSRAKEFEDELRNSRTEIIYPLEGYRSAPFDVGGPELHVLSPPARILRELVTTSDIRSFITGNEMAMGWLLEPPPPTAEQEGDLDHFDAALQRGYLVASDLSDRLCQRVGSVSESAPEWFGDPLVNNTSLVIWLGLRTGTRHHSLLLTGDLENWTYLMARYPRGLHADVMKASHHGGKVKLEKDLAHDEILSQVRPQAVLVSGCGEHELPHTDFRNAAIRWGSTVFCTSERGAELVSGQSSPHKCCCNEYHCHRDTRDIELTLDQVGIRSNVVACHSGFGVLPGPVIQMRQHLIEPSPIISRLFEEELAKHIRWVRGQLQDMHRDRTAATPPSELGTDPIPAEAILNRADKSRRQRLVPHINTVLAEGMKRGAFWAQGSPRWNEGWTAYRLPTDEDASQLVHFVKNKDILIFDHAVQNADSLDPSSVLQRLATIGLALQTNIFTHYPHDIFRDTFWPHLTSTFTRSPWHAFLNREDGSIALSKANTPRTLVEALVRFLDPEGEGRATYGSEYDWRSDSTLAYGKHETRQQEGRPLWKQYEVMPIVQQWMQHRNSYSYGNSMTYEKSLETAESRIAILW